MTGSNSAWLVSLHLFRNLQKEDGDEGVTAHNSYFPTGEAWGSRPGSDAKVEGVRKLGVKGARKGVNALVFQFRHPTGFPRLREEEPHAFHQATKPLPDGAIPGNRSLLLINSADTGRVGGAGRRAPLLKGQGERRSWMALEWA